VAARYASVGSCSGCVAGSPNTEIPAIVKQTADTAALRDPTTGVTIRIFFPSGKGCLGEPVEAVVHMDYTWLPYLNLGHTTISASATMRLDSPYNATTSPYTPDPAPSLSCT
jgi:hypothetical protein